MSEVIERLRSRRSSVWEEAKKVTDAASMENRTFTAEEEQAYTRLNAELDALDARIKDMIEGEQRAKDTEHAFLALEGKAPERSVARPGEDELRAFLRGEPGAPRSYMVMPDPAELRDLSKLTGPAGGDLVPTSFYGRLVEHMIETSGILQTGATVLNTSGGEPIVIPKTLTHVDADLVAEAAPIPEEDPTFDNISLGAYKYGRLIQVSRELVDDNGVDLEGYLARSAGRALGNAIGQHLAVGTGTNQPRGVIVDASAGVVGPAGTTIGFGNQATVGQGFDLLISLFHSVISPYRMSRACAWLMNDTTASLVRRIKSTDGVYAWQPSLTADDPDRILGKPVYIDPFLASPAANAESIAFGDWSAYFVRFAGGIRFERSDDFAFGTDLVSFRALLRGDGALADLTGAVKTFQHSAT